ncbi:MAG TPA: alanine racemase [Nocardioidaceae bacterium]
MPLTLYVDGPRWRSHLRATADANRGIVPVAKGNGYGFTIGRLARRAEWLGVDMLAVGTYAEVAEVRQRFSGDVLVLEPWRPFLPTLVYDDRLIHTVGRAQDLKALADIGDTPRVLLETLTSMNRHGFQLDTLAGAAATARGVHIEGHALHLPLGEGHLDEVERCLATAPEKRWYVSHLTAAELTQLRTRHPGVEFRPRIGTALWLGDKQALSPRATVLDARDVQRGERAGYRGRRFSKPGTLLVVSGGTTHGVALEAPTPASSARQRAVAVARGGLEATGRALSPFVVDGKQRWFVEPPHMQVSLVFVPAGARAPGVGDEIDVQVRFTTTRFDAIEIS